MSYLISRRVLLGASLSVLPAAQGAEMSRYTRRETKYEFTTNRCRLATRYAVIKNDVRLVTMLYLGTAEFQTHSYRLAFSLAANNTNGRYPTELSGGGPFEIESIAIGHSDVFDPKTANWIVGTFQGERNVHMSVGGTEQVLSDDIVSSENPVRKGEHRWASILVNVPAGAQLPISYRFAPGQEFEGVMNVKSNVSGNIISHSIPVARTSRQTSGFGPSYIVSKGGDGRPSFLIWGDSIGYGENEIPETYDHGIFGFVPRGLEMTDGSQRMFGGNFCIPGSRPSDWTNFGRPAVEKKLNLINLCPNLPFTHILSQHGTNSAGVWNGPGEFSKGMIAYAQLLKHEFPGVPIVQTTIFPKAKSIDGYRSLEQQSPLSGFDIGEEVDAFNKNLTSGNYREIFDLAIDPASLVSTGPGRWITSNFMTVLSERYSGGNTIVVQDAPPRDVGLVLHDLDTKTFEAAHVLSVSETSPYEVTISKQLRGTYERLATVTGTFNIDTTHPEAAAHKIAADSVHQLKASL